MFNIIPENFFVPLASPNKIVYWDCITKLFSVMDQQLSFGIEREVLVDVLEYYFDQANAVDLTEEDMESTNSRSKANLIIRKLESYGWIEIETDKSYVQRVNFTEYAIRGQIKEILLELNSQMNEKQMDMNGIYEIDFLDEMIHLYHTSVLDERSFYAPTEGRKEFVPKAIEAYEPDLQQRQEKMRKMMEKMERILNPEKINAYILEKMQDRETMLASELPLEDTEAFIKVIYVRLYGQRKKMSY